MWSTSSARPTASGALDTIREPPRHPRPRERISSCGRCIRALNAAERLGNPQCKHLFTDVYDVMPWMLVEQRRAHRIGARGEGGARRSEALDDVSFHARSRRQLKAHLRAYSEHYPDIGRGEVEAL